MGNVATVVSQAKSRFYVNWTNNSLDDLLPRGNGLCLDLGSGSGNNKSIINGAGWPWVGMDPENRGGLSVMGDAADLPFLAESFGCVVMWQVLEHLPNPWRSLTEVTRVLVPGGRLVGSASFLEPFHDRASYFGFSHVGLRHLLEDSGLRVEIIEPGITSFSLILRDLLTHFLRDRVGQVVAFGLTHMWLNPLLLLARTAARGVSLLGISRAMQAKTWLQTTAPFVYAGHLRFVARKPRKG